MVAIIIACAFVIFFLRVVPRFMYSLFCFTFSAVLGVTKFTLKLLSVFALFGVAKFIFKKVKTVK